MTQAELRAFGLGLGQIVTNTFHYTAPENTSANYAVWAELSGVALSSDNKQAEGRCEIAIDYFTKTEFDGTIDSISSYLNNFGSWHIESVQFEPETRYIHYEWRLDYA